MLAIRIRPTMQFTNLLDLTMTMVTVIIFKSVHLGQFAVNCNFLIVLDLPYKISFYGSRKYLVKSLLKESNTEL